LSILIVEDDVDVREALATFLAGEGYDVVEAGDGAEALERLRGSTVVRLILLDLMMPVMNGWEFRKRQLEDPALATIPVVVVTADNSAVRRAADAGAVACLLKPVEFPDLLAYVGRYCGSV
jgi:two-component system, chemotaxis family, chemotaxis protein CheY